MFNLTAGKLFLFATFFVLMGAHAPLSENQSPVKSKARFACTNALDLYVENDSATTVPIWVTFNSGCQSKGFKVGSDDAKSGNMIYDQDIQITFTFPFGATTGRIRIYNNGATNLIACIPVSSLFSTYYYTVYNATSDAIWVYYDVDPC